jgi:phosphoribosylglycinamide formyltransferase-1
MAQDTSDTGARIVVLASGSGSNLQVLLDAVESGWSVVGVVSDQPDARALQRAAAANVPSRVVEWGDHAGRNEFTDAICAAAGEFDPDYIVLAGFMRVLGPSAVVHFPGRIINIHPSLLPAFPGAHGVRDALAYGAKVTGVTIHFVDEHLDHGPIIAQEAVVVMPGDDETALHSRIQVVEHRLLPEVVTRLAGGEFEISGRIVKRRVNV